MSTLAQEIERYKEHFKTQVPSNIQDLMLEQTQLLIQQDLKNKAKNIGDKIGEFSLLNAHDKIIHIKDIIDSHKYTVLSFYRGAWCPYCNLELRALQKIKKELKILDAEIVAISPQTPAHAIIDEDKNHLDFEILSDKNNTVAKSLGIVFTLPEVLRPVYDSFGIDLLEMNKNGTFDLPFPAIFIINQNYEIIFRFVDEDYTKRCEPQEILTAIKKDIINKH